LARRTLVDADGDPSVFDGARNGRLSLDIAGSRHPTVDSSAPYVRSSANARGPAANACALQGARGCEQGGRISTTGQILNQTTGVVCLGVDIHE